MKTNLAFPALAAALIAAGIASADAKDKVVSIDGGRVSVALPPGWKESEQNQKGSDSIAGYESSDRKSSFYILELKLPSQGDNVYDALDRTIANFDADENWIVSEIGKTKDSTVNGIPAAYSRVELALVSGEREVPFVFYFTMVGGQDAFFMLQASTMKPVRTVREQEIFRMIKSFKVLKE